MTALNNKGFMLAEVVIVSAVIITALVGLYTGFSNTYKAAQTKSKYYDVNGVYKLKIVEKYLLKEMVLNNDIAFLNGLYDDDNESDDLRFDVNLNNLFNEEDNYFESVVLVKYNNLNLVSFGNSLTDTDKEFKEFVDYYVRQIDNYDNYSYVLFGKSNKGDFSTLRIP